MTGALNVHKVSLLISAVSRKQYPPTFIPEIALTGRSNVGKSSLLNRVLNRTNFARVSATPGKTATVNFYDVDQKLMLVDLPGYGYAHASKREIEAWGRMIEEYLHTRRQLTQVILLVDARHKPTNDDVLMFEWIRAYNERAVVVATKCDKLKKSEFEGNMTRIYETLELGGDDILLPFSAKAAQSARDFWAYIEEHILKKEEGQNDEVPTV
jgi:GTP-binding protein